MVWLLAVSFATATTKQILPPTTKYISGPRLLDEVGIYPRKGQVLFWMQAELLVLLHRRSNPSPCAEHMVLIMMLEQTYSSATVRTISLAKEVVGREVIDASGFKAGRVRDLVVRFIDGRVQVAGIVVHNRFVPWQVVKSFGIDVYLNTRWFALGAQPIPGDAVLVCQHVLGEQLLDQHGRHVGHVDDIGLVWDSTARELRFDHVLTGPYLSIGVSQGSQRIPWTNVIGIKNKPRAVVVRRNC